MKTYLIKTNLGIYTGLFRSVWDAIDDALVKGATKINAGRI